MKKLLRIVAVLFVLLIVVVFIAVSYVDRIAKSGIETATTTMLGVPTAIDSLHIKLLTAEGKMSGLNIANPEGYTKSPHFLEMEKAEMGVSLRSLTGDTVEVPYIRLDGLDISLEKKGGKANYDVILANLKKGESQPTPTADQKGGKKFVVREIVITNLVVHVDTLPIGGNATRLEVPIAEIRLTDIGSDSDNGMVMKELSGTIVKAVFAAIAKKGGGLIPADITQGLSEGLSGLSNVGDIGVKFAGEAAQQVGKIADDLGKNVGEVGKDVGKTLEDMGGLFKKKK